MYALNCSSRQITVRSGDEAVVITSIESPGLLGFAVRVGYRCHVVGTAAGMALFGFSSEAARKTWLASLRRSAPRGADFDKFSADAAIAKRRGYVIVDSATVSTVTDIAAPITDGIQRMPVAALTVPVLARVDSSADVAKVASAVVRSAEVISGKLRHS
jgi:DNA-binding IclR family transcriptional regulator